MPAMMSASEANRSSVRGSPSNRIPNAAAPSAPMPVHTAYAVPTGNVRTASASRYIEPAIATSVTTLATGLVKPCEYLRPTAQTVSSTPATMSIAQARFMAPKIVSRGWRATSTIRPMIAPLLGLWLACQNPQAPPGTLDADVYRDSASGIALRRPWSDWVFAPSRGRGVTTVFFYPRDGTLDQFLGALAVTSLRHGVQLDSVADQRIAETWQPVLGATFQLLARDSLAVHGLPAIHVVVSGAIGGTPLDVEEYLIARGNDLIVLQFRYPRSLPRDSLTLGYDRAFRSLEIRSDAAPDTAEAGVAEGRAGGADSAAPAPLPTPAPPPPAVAPDAFAPPPQWRDIYATLGGSPWRVSRVDALVRLPAASAPLTFEIHLDIVNDGLTSTDELPLWLPAGAILDSLSVASRVVSGLSATDVRRLPLPDTITFEGHLALTLFYHRAPISGLGIFLDDWLPAVECPVDSLGRARATGLATVSIRFDVPESVVPVATGHLSAQLITSDRLQQTWTADGVAATRPGFVIGALVPALRTTGRLSVTVWRTAGTSVPLDSCARLVAGAWAFGARAFGLVMAPEVNVVVGAPDALGAPGLVLLSPGSAVNPQQVREAVARTWWGGAVRGTGDGAMVIDDGLAAWSAALMAGDTVGSTPGPDVRTKTIAAMEAARRRLGGPRFREAVRTFAVEHRAGFAGLDDLASVLGDSGVASLKQVQSTR